MKKHDFKFDICKFSKNAFLIFLCAALIFVSMSVCVFSYQKTFQLLNLSTVSAKLSSKTNNSLTNNFSTNNSLANISLARTSSAGAGASAALNLYSSAKGACVMETSTGRVLFSKNQNQKLPMASTTKIMTAITAIENCQNLDERFEISPKAVGVPGTSLYLRKGDIYSTRDLLYALMLISGNDASVAIAEHVAGSTSEFVTLMNDLARKIGVKHTHFANTHGLDADGHYTTAYDLAKITAYALENDTFREIVGTKTVKILKQTSQPAENEKSTKTQNYGATQSSGATQNGTVRNNGKTQQSGKIENNVKNEKENDGAMESGDKTGSPVLRSENRYLRNKNKLLFSLDGCIGVKTGFTDDAGRCLVSAIEKNGLRIVCVVLNCGPMFPESEQLLKTCAENFRLVDVTELYDYDTSVAVEDGRTPSTVVGTTGHFVYPLTDAEIARLKFVYSCPKTLTAPLEKGAEVGEVEVFLDKDLLFSEKIVTIECVKPKTVLQRMKDFFGNWANGSAENAEGADGVKGMKGPENMGNAQNARSAENA